jgi:hypothetical protein
MNLLTMINNQWDMEEHIYEILTMVKNMRHMRSCRITLDFFIQPSNRNSLICMDFKSVKLSPSHHHGT